MAESAEKAMIKVSSLALMLLLWTSASCLSCRLAPSKATDESATPNASTSTVHDINDPDWEIKLIGKIPDEEADRISSTKEGFYWVWGSRSIWIPEGKGNWRQIYHLKLFEIRKPRLYRNALSGFPENCVDGQ